MPSAVTDAIDAYRAGLLRNEQAQMAEAARRWLQVEQALQAQVDALAYELANTSRPTMGQLGRSRRYVALQRQVDDELGRYATWTNGRLVDAQRNAALAAISHSQATVNAIATEAQIVVPFNRLPVSATENMIGLAGDGSPLRTLLNDAARVGPDAMAQELINGIALGRNPLEVARRAMRLGLGQSFTRMQLISRTEQLRVYRETSLQSYRASNVVVGYKRLSARDERTCIACLFADGRVYGLNEGFDEHPAGRCTMVPILANVPPVQFEDGKTWFRRQPESTQRAMLGRGRFEAWKAGEASLDDMVSRDWDDTWGGSLRVTRVRDLAAGRGGLPAARRLPSAPPAPRVVEWKPSMSRADAELWAKDSAVKVDTYHVTTGVKNERSIAENGFDLSRTKFGRMWGDGVYVGTDEATAAQYRGWTGPAARTMKIKVDVRNPAIFNAAGRTFGPKDVVSEILGIDKDAAGALMYDKKTKSLIDMSTVLKNNGFDALDIRGANNAAGGNQMVIFDPKKVVVIND